MDYEDKLLPFLKEHAVALVLGVAGLLFLGYGLINLSQPQSVEKTMQFQTGQDATAPVKSTISQIVKQITIAIEGAVFKPGVYTLSANSRMQDALIAAGGLSQNADRQQVAQNLNLAAPLTDGAKIYIPAVGEQVTTSGGSSDTISSETSEKSVNINQANESELDALPGVGLVTAQKIISNRPYQNVQELLDKKIVGTSEFRKIKGIVSVY